MTETRLASEGERRRAVRVTRSIEFRYAANCPPIRARLDDLSDAGAFVDTSHPLPLGTSVEFDFQLPNDPNPIRGRARVAWAQQMVGVGLEFTELEAADRERVRLYVASVYFGHDLVASPS